MFKFRNSGEKCLLRMSTEEYKKFLFIKEKSGIKTNKNFILNQINKTELISPNLIFLKEDAIKIKEYSETINEITKHCNSLKKLQHIGEISQIIESLNEISRDIDIEI